MMERWVYRTFVVGLMLLVAILIAPHPIATNDGPVHLAFSNLMVTLHQPGHPLQQKAYYISLGPYPNLTIYILLDSLIRVVPPDIAESVIQILSIVGPIAACYFALGMINPRNVWLAVFLLPLSLNQMFFLGLYNHCISIAAFFLAIATYYWMLKAPSFARAAAVSGLLILAFFSHASGFIMAFAGIATISAILATRSYFRSRDLRACY
jgi:hypothetical protein